MRRLSTLLIAAPVTFGLLAAPAAHAEWRGNGGGYPERGGYDRHGHGGSLAGVLLGLGAAAVIGGIIATQPRYYQPPPVVYAPPRGYQPGYQPAPVYQPGYMPPTPSYERPSYQPAYPAYQQPSYPAYERGRYPGTRGEPAYRGTEDDDAE